VSSWEEMLYAKIAALEGSLTKHRSRSRWLKESRDRWKKRAVQTDWNDTRLLQAKVVKLEKALTRERFLNSMSRGNAQRREANREGNPARGSEREAAAA
jgi:hypothetical protein